MKKAIPTALCLVLVLSLAACNNNRNSSSSDSQAPEGQTLIGKARGYGGEITATVTVDANGKITEVAVDAPDETTGVGTIATDSLPATIAEAGTTEGVEVVAGATVTSNAIIAAVNNAIDPEAYPYDPDATASASPKESSDPAALVNGLSADGYWIFSILSDVTLEDEFVVEGTFYNKDDTSGDVYRKLALYAQDADRNVTANYTLTVPKMTVKSPNFRIQNGTVVGDIYVEAEGFELVNTVVEGNVTFASQAIQDSATIDTATIDGETSVG